MKTLKSNCIVRSFLTITLAASLLGGSVYANETASFGPKQNEEFKQELSQKVSEIKKAKKAAKGKNSKKSKKSKRSSGSYIKTTLKVASVMAVSAVVVLRVLPRKASKWNYVFAGDDYVTTASQYVHDMSNKVESNILKAFSYFEYRNQGFTHEEARAGALFGSSKHKGKHLFNRIRNFF